LRPRLTPFQGAVLTWGQGGRRDLPWRRTRDPWAILVSELMLQQTQVGRVVPRYHAFLARFPDPAACASAGAGAVVEAWQGLGYNRRAISLHRAATAVVERHDGHLPHTLSELITLPGIGPYTARAVLAFAFESARPLVRLVNSHRRAIDLAIAATANVHGVPLLTADSADFAVIGDLVDIRSFNAPEP